MNKHLKCVSIGLFFFSLLILGLNSYRQYGISWDDPFQRLTGAVTVNYLAKRFSVLAFLASQYERIPPLPKYKDRDYGVAFEAPAFALEQLLRLTDYREIYMFRHLLIFLVSLGGVYAVYRLASRRFSNWRIGLLSALFLVLTPRLFAESFYNSKDIVFMAAFAVAMNTTISLVLKPSMKTALLNALASAFAMDVRLMALLLPIVSVIMLIARLVRRELSLRTICLVLGVYLISTCVLVVAMWPYLWSDPYRNFVQAFKNMAKFRWDFEVRYMGAFIRSTALPWHYTLTWITVTTPLLYLALFVVGVFATCRQICARRLKIWQDDGELRDIIVAVLFFVPIGAVSLMHSVLYDGWRQMYFVYPAFLLLATKGWMALWNMQSNQNAYRAALIASTSISVIYTAMWIWNARPMQGVYFNVLAGKNWKARYDLDYWGVGNREALEYILANDHSPVINVREDSWTPLIFSLLILKSDDRQRVKLANDKVAPYYVITNYRGVRDTDNSSYRRDYDLFYEIRVEHEVILSVFKWKESG
jgi:Dolichyl-phosphate-mannose-protein mannosyltransferase